MNSGINPRGSGLRARLDDLLVRNISTLLRLSGGRLYRRFVESSKDVRRTQQAVLDELVRYGAATELGRERGLGGVRTLSELRQAVPVMDYEDYRPYIDRHCQGERDVLFPGKPLMYNRTSGTTAHPKLIPVTPYNFERSVKDRGKLWLYGLMRHYPKIFAGKDLSLVSSAEEGYTADGTPYGSLSGLIYKNIPAFMKRLHTTPYEAVTIKDHEAKIYTLTRFAFPSDVSCILTGNPSSVVTLLNAIDRWKDVLIRDIHDGTLRSDLDLEPAIRAQCEQRLAPAPERARELERLAERHGRLRTEHYWPNLALVHTWTNGNCRLMLPKLEPWLGEGTPVLDFGYIASEVTATDLIDPRTQGSVLQVQNTLFEFSPFEEGTSPKTFLTAEQLELGGQYYVYVTTFNGLYRYDMNDVLEVVDFFYEVPVVRFLFKGKGITNLQGEKLSEAQFIEALEQAAEATGMSHEFFVGIADAEVSQYVLYIELCGRPEERRVEAFAETLDRSLCEVNIEYQAKRHSGRLKPVRIVQLGAQAFEKYRSIRLDEGALEGQLKWLNLCGTETERDRMDQLVSLSRSASPGSCYDNA